MGTRARRRSVKLVYPGPLAWDALLEFLAPRAMPGVAVVDGDVYRRGAVAVRHRPAESCVIVEGGTDRDGDATRAARLFDLVTDPAPIAAVLGADEALAPVVRALPGLRVPGCWDPFEIAVRAILGQQVTVKGATTLAGRLVETFGGMPSPAGLAARDFDIGMPRARVRALRELGRAVADGDVDLEEGDRETLEASLVGLPGIGPWTASYLAMRLGHADAFPAGDLGLRKALGVTERELRTRAERWRPYRAYAAVHVWRLLG